MVEQRTDIDFVIQKCKELVKDQYLIRVRLPTVAKDTDNKDGGGGAVNNDDDELKDEERFVIPHGNNSLKFHFFVSFYRKPYDTRMYNTNQEQI